MDIVIDAPGADGGPGASGGMEVPDDIEVTGVIAIEWIIDNRLWLVFGRLEIGLAGA